MGKSTPDLCRGLPVLASERAANDPITHQRTRLLCEGGSMSVACGVQL